MSRPPPLRAHGVQPPHVADLEGAVRPGAAPRPPSAAAALPTAIPPGTPPPAGAHTALAFDYGSLRVGVAVGSTVRGRGQPLRTLNQAGNARWAAIAAVIAEWQPAVLVVGVPLHPDGQPHENTARALRFARQLNGRHRLPVQLVDERYSSVEAAAAGAPKALLDAHAAAVILDRYLAQWAANACSPSTASGGSAPLATTAAAPESPAPEPATD